MAKHQAPTAVTIAPLAEASPFELAVKRYWLPLGSVVLLGVVAILWNHSRGQGAEAARESSWETLGAALQPQPTGLPGGDPAQLQEVATKTEGGAAGPWARLIHARALVDQRRYDEALQALDQLESSKPQGLELVTSVPHSLPQGEMTLLASMRAAIQEIKAWEAAHPELLGLPELPADAPRVRVHTDKGAFVIGLYREQAPEHVENFLQLAKDGFYSGTRFHRSGSGFLQGGDPNSKDLEKPETWGAGATERKLTPKPNGLAHFAGAVSAARADGESQESGCQFIVAHSSAHQLDDKHTVFGRVMEGLEVLSAIASLPLAEGSTERPAQPAVIEKIEIL